MRRALVLTALLLTVAPAAAPAAPPAPPKLGATLKACTTSALPVERIASFVGSMPARAGATRMRMRFDLERRKPGERRWRRIRVEGFGVWEHANPQVAGFVFNRRITSLPVPAVYRALVRFEWKTPDGTTRKRAREHTAACRQLDLRPDLVPGALTAVLDQLPGLAVYTLVVRNIGRSQAGPSSVRVGTASVELAALEAGGERAVPVVALACLALTPIVVRVDADRRIEESAEPGNGVRRQCPLVLG